MGFVEIHDPVYQNTRKLILSHRNPYYFSGKAGKGIGGPHQGLGYIWPMTIAMQALTSLDLQEKEACLSLLIESTAETGWIHESFWMHDVYKYTREWFAWANSLVGELLYNLALETGFNSINS